MKYIIIILLLVLPLFSWSIDNTIKSTYIKNDCSLGYYILKEYNGNGVLVAFKDSNYKYPIKFRLKCDNVERIENGIFRLHYGDIDCRYINKDF